VQVVSSLAVTRIDLVSDLFSRVSVTVTLTVCAVPAAPEVRLMDRVVAPVLQPVLTDRFQARAHRKAVPFYDGAVHRPGQGSRYGFFRDCCC
jgi:hypothetical protein